MHTSKRVTTPMESSFQTDKKNRTINSKYTPPEFTYRLAVGCPVFLMTGTRPDIAFEIIILAKFSTNTLPDHLTAVKRVLRYVSGTSNNGITCGIRKIKIYMATQIRIVLDEM